MKVLKFGGSSVGSPERVRGVIEIVQTRLTPSGRDSAAPIAVVVSAFQGVTDNLIRLAQNSAARESEAQNAARSLLDELRSRHLAAVDALIPDPTGRKQASEGVDALIAEIRDIARGVSLVHEASTKTIDQISSFGERLSAFIIAEAMKAFIPNTEYLDARAIVSTDSTFGSASVDFATTDRKIREYFNTHPALQIVTGFIGSSPKGETTTLGRGGSDYTAAILGAALDAEEIEIWTDVDGVMTADPRRVAKAFPIPTLSYEEAMELCHFGAKVIYPPTFQPAFNKRIPLRVKNTFRPEVPGTLISETPPPSPLPVSGISSISDIALIRVQGSGMIGVAGIAKRLFGALASRNISIILITQASSEHSICVAVSPQHLSAAREVLESEFALEIAARQIDPISIEEKLSIIAIVGESMRRTPGVSGKLFQALGKNGVNVIAIAQGSSELNISVVTAASDEAKALNALHDAFFLSDVKTVNLFLAGTGMVGAALLGQLNAQRERLSREQQLSVRLVGIADSKQLHFANNGISFAEWRERLSSSKNKMTVPAFLSAMFECNLPNSVFIDCTASEELAESYESILRRAISIITPNKKANSGSWQRYRQLKEAATKSNVKFLYETNVGAALPVLSTLRDLRASGDQILRIEAVLSGTLSFIFNSYNGSQSFSAIVREAKKRGYTEPDPRDDLSGRDVGRKLLILAREMDLPLEEDQISVQSLVPESCRAASSADGFLKLLEQADGDFEKRRKDAESKGQVLRYIGRIEPTQTAVALDAVGPEHPFFSLSGTDNIIAFTTERYREQPLVVKGAGAGTEVTAAGILADLLRVSSYL